MGILYFLNMHACDIVIRKKCFLDEWVKKKLHGLFRGLVVKLVGYDERINSM
jgi:hypothetical protein